MNKVTKKENKALSKLTVTEKVSFPKVLVATDKKYDHLGIKLYKLPDGEDLTVNLAKKVLENLIKNGIFVRMPYSYPQNRCIRVTVGLDKDIDLFEKYLPVALKES